MKTIQKILAAGVILLSATSCVGDYEMPSLPAPSYDGPEANFTIADYRERFASTASGTLIEDDLILHAIVTGDDESGNIYRQLIIQDSTGGISVQIDETSLYNTYHVGQELYLDLQGLYVSVYGNELQIAYADGDRIPSETFDEHAHRNDWPHPENVVPKDFTDISELNDDVNGNVFTLVRLNDVHFLNGDGETQFAPVAGEYGQEYLEDQYGNQLLVRTSGYCDFRTETLPVGTGKVMGILGRYNGTWQLTIRSIDDVYGFDGIPVGDDDTPSGSLTTLFSESFANGQGDFTIENKTMDSGLSYVWTADTDYGYMKASAYVSGSNKNAESWLISPVIDLSGASGCELTFSHVGNFFNGTMSENATVWGRVDGGEWSQLDLDGYPAADGWSPWVSATVDLSRFDGEQMQFAFVYKSSTSVSGTWEVEDVEVKGNK